MIQNVFGDIVVRHPLMIVLISCLLPEAVGGFREPQSLDARLVRVAARFVVVPFNELRFKDGLFAIKVFIVVTSCLIEDFLVANATLLAIFFVLGLFKGCA